MEVQQMDLSGRERQALRSIEGGLTESDPDLAAKLAKLCQLMTGEDMPAAERIRARRRNVVGRSLIRWLHAIRGRRHARTHSRLGSALLVLWLAVSCALIATAAALSHVAAGRPCDVLVVHCDSQTPASPARGAR
jgi:hypothetical protein